MDLEPMYPGFESPESHDLSYAPPQKVAGYYVIPSELLSVRPSVRQRLNIRVRSITLIPFEIISHNLVQI